MKLNALFSSLRLNLHNPSMDSSNGVRSNRSFLLRFLLKVKSISPKTKKCSMKQCRGLWDTLESLWGIFFSEKIMENKLSHLAKWMVVSLTSETGGSGSTTPRLMTTLSPTSLPFTKITTRENVLMPLVKTNFSMARFKFQQERRYLESTTIFQSWKSPIYCTHSAFSSGSISNSNYFHAYILFNHTGNWSCDPFPFL